MWTELIQGIASECQFHPPATAEKITSAEASLGLAFPEDLKELLLESNGVHGEDGLDLIWPVERIDHDNMDFRQNTDYKELYMSFDSLLFFGDAGNGDQFAFPVHNGVIYRDDIFIWNHEDDSRIWVAPSLKIYLEWQLKGTINNGV